MEADWGFFLLLSVALVRCGHGQVIKEECVNIKDQLSLSCPNTSPEQFTSVIDVTHLCLCYSGCGTCFCAKGDWEICDRLQRCTIFLSEDVIRNVKSSLSVSEPVLLLLMTNVYAKIVYTCTEVEKSTTTTTTKQVSATEGLSHSSTTSKTTINPTSEAARSTTPMTTRPDWTTADKITIYSKHQAVTVNVIAVAVGSVVAVNVTLVLIILTVVIIRRQKRNQSEARVEVIVTNAAQPVAESHTNQLYESETKSVASEKVHDAE